MDSFIIIFILFFILVAFILTCVVLYYTTDDYFVGIVVFKTKEYYYVDNLSNQTVIKCKSNKKYNIGDRVTAFRKYLSWYLV